jgi:hypothetical protein
MRVQSTVASCGTLGMGDGVGDCLGGVPPRARYGRCARWWLVDGGPGVHVFLFGAGHHDGGPRVTGQSVEWVKLTRRSKPGERAVTRTRDREGERMSCKLSNSTLTVHVRLYALHAICYNIQAGGGAQSPPYSGTAYSYRTLDRPAPGCTTDRTQGEETARHYGTARERSCMVSVP